MSDELVLESTNTGHYLGVASVAAHPLGSITASSSLDSFVRIFDVDSNATLATLEVPPSKVWQMRFDPKGAILAVAGRGSASVKLWDTSTWVVATLSIPRPEGPKPTDKSGSKKFVLSVAWGPDGKRLACGSMDGTISVFYVQRANHGVVANDDGRCSRIGMDALREGGHAVDAIVAATLCLGVVSPASSGLGGGAFMLLRLANGVAKAFDMRELAPLLASKDMYGGNTTLKAKGGLSVAVPGELAGLHNVWKQHGKLPWQRLVKPAEILARRGFKISPYAKIYVTIPFKIGIVQSAEYS